MKILKNLKAYRKINNTNEENNNSRMVQNVAWKFLFELKGFNKSFWLQLREKCDWTC